MIFGYWWLVYIPSPNFRALDLCTFLLGERITIGLLVGSLQGTMWYLGWCNPMWTTWAGKLDQRVKKHDGPPSPLFLHHCKQIKRFRWTIESQTSTHEVFESHLRACNLQVCGWTQSCCHTHTMHQNMRHVLLHSSDPDCWKTQFLNLAPCNYM